MDCKSGSFAGISPSADPRNLRSNTHLRGTDKTYFMIIYVFSGLQKGMMAILERQLSC